MAFPEDNSNYQIHDHPTEGLINLTAPPVKFSETPGNVTAGAPVYGQHTREVLAEYGFDEGEIDTLVSSGAVIAD